MAAGDMNERFEAGRFTGMVAVVTGAGSGIGRATALRLAREGAKLVAADVVASRLDDLVARHPGLDLIPVAGDIAADGGAQALVDAAGGRVDVLANVAGIMDGFLPAAEVDDATWDRVFSVNVTAVMKLCRAVLPLMVAAGGGAIVNVVSEAALRGSQAGAAYTASKHAVVGLTRSMSVMYAVQGVRTNAIAPGSVITSIEAASRSAHGTAVLAPFLATGPPAATSEQVAASITWLLSGDADNVNGVVLPCDGGMSAT